MIDVIFIFGAICTAEHILLDWLTDDVSASQIGKKMSDTKYYDSKLKWCIVSLMYARNKHTKLYNHKISAPFLFILSESIKFPHELQKQLSFRLKPFKTFSCWLLKTFCLYVWSHHFKYNNPLFLFRLRLFELLLWWRPVWLDQGQRWRPALGDDTWSSR